MLHETHNLAGYVEGTLSPDALARVNRHLESCGRCRSALANMRAAHRVLRAVGQTGPEPHYDTELWSRVRAQIARPTARPALRARWAFATGGFALAGAAVWLVVMTYAPIDGPALTGKQLPSTPASPGVSQSAKPVNKTRMAAAPATAMPVRPSLATPGADADRPTIELPTGSAAPLASPALRNEVAPAKKEMLAGAPQTASGGESFGGSAALTAPAKRDRAAGLKMGVAGKDKGASEGPVSLFYEATPSAAKVDSVSGPTHPVAAPPVVRGSASDSAATRAPGLEIVTETAPEMPSSLGLRGQVGERTLMAKSEGPLALGSAGTAPPRFRSTPVTTGAPTVEGLRLLSKANDAYSRGKNDLAYQYYTDAFTAGLDSGQARLVDVRRGDIALQANDTTNAIRFYRAAVLKAKDAATLTKLGDAYERAGNAKEAQAAFKEALTLSPGYAPAREGEERVKGK